MRTLIRSALVLSFVVGALGAGCSSSGDDTAAGGSSGSGGSGGRASGGSSHGGSGGTAHSTAGTESSNAGAAGNPSTPEGGAPSEAAGAPNAGAPNAGGSNGGTSSSAGAGGLPDVTAGAGGGGPVSTACNALALTAASIGITYNVAPAPSDLTQGTIQSGTYRLTSLVNYNSASGDAMAYAANGVVSVSDKTATLTLVDSQGITETLVIVEGTPASVAPVSITLTCSSDPENAASIGVELKGNVSYQTTDTTFSLYIASSHLLEVFTLQA